MVEQPELAGPGELHYSEGSVLDAPTVHKSFHPEDREVRWLTRVDREEWLDKTSSLLLSQLGNFKQWKENGFGADGCGLHLWLHHVSAMTLSSVFNFLSFVSIYKTGAVQRTC